MKKGRHERSNEAFTDCPDSAARLKMTAYWLIRAENSVCAVEAFHADKTSTSLIIAEKVFPWRYVDTNRRHVGACRLLC